MKSLLLLSCLTVTLFTNSFANVEKALRHNLTGPYLEIFIVNPPNPIKWSTPGKLLKSSLKNAISKDYAPNGHFIVYLKSDTPNRFGVKNILTGVSRANSRESIRITREEKLGLSALFHTFEGALDYSRSDVAELARAKQENRLSSLVFPLTSEKAKTLMGFLDNYITYGSFKRYGGNKNTATGEGSGCADFAYQFIKLATDGRIPDSEWKTSVYVPKKLMKFVSGREDKSITFAKILLNGGSWASSSDDGVLFTTPDPEKMSAWILKHSQSKKLIYDFEGRYPYIEQQRFIKEGKSTISADTISATWKKISAVNENELP